MSAAVQSDTDWVKDPAPAPINSTAGTTNIAAVLDERGRRYGKFLGHAQVAQDLKLVVYRHLALRDKQLDADQSEAIDMILHKIARVINGDPGYVDNFRDMAGYAQLVVDRMLETDGATDTDAKRTVRIDGVWEYES